MCDRVLTQTILSPGHSIPAGGEWLGVWASRADGMAKANMASVENRSIQRSPKSCRLHPGTRFTRELRLALTVRMKGVLISSLEHKPDRRIRAASLRLGHTGGGAEHWRTTLSTRMSGCQRRKTSDDYRRACSVTLNLFARGINVESAANRFASRTIDSAIRNRTRQRRRPGCSLRPFHRASAS